ncbi:hypothetical protein GIB67_034490 [Kingdonia uniflora]|uniref:Protein kinase domain-containing protein n=1 Tax=Kingdonia uniflora TaxID=39325 RepID=A0A7J7PBR0_9MAGN|nr:hypothetical protein GIB67_034490 [Kingdonia uniflora]
MNHYHIYEAIGRGKYSTVYKARKKKTIEYFACKSVDKSQKPKVLQEIRVLHSLEHPNVLRFYAWYETSAHLWLVLEYCVGGDLMTLLGQDGQLPEDSVHDLARDLLKALQFLHSNGIIYCDLKPSNILLDENGRTKLCDFGLARRLSDISKTPSSQLPQAKRGTPCYMAPELFQDGGVHSYASDFWALGCVLYECYTGRPPFVGKEFTQLVKSILSDPIPPLSGNPSLTFIHLINSLLIKDPAERIQWSELCQHSFWRTKFTPVSLPPQSAFANMIELTAKPCLSELNGDKPPPTKTPTKTRPRGFETPVKNVSSVAKAQVKVKQKEFSSATRGVNLLRLSKIAKTNLQRENEKENYRRPLPNSCKDDAEVQIENNDMELNFDENTEDEAHEETDGPDNLTCTLTAKLSTENQSGKIEVTDLNTNQSDNEHETNMDICDDSKELEQESCSGHVDVASTPPSSGNQRRVQRVKTGSGSGPDSDSSRSVNDLSQLLWHPSDLALRPVMPSRKGDKVSGGTSLPIDALPPSEFVKISKEHLDKFNSRTIALMTGSTSLGEKQNMIKYLEILSGNTDAANILTNGPIMPALVRVLRLSKVSTLRVQIASVIGLLIRHSTLIEDEVASSGLLVVLTHGVRDNHDKLRRFSMAALGELLFYISTQNGDNSAAESPSKDGRSASGWQVPSAVIALVSSVLRKGEDDITQLYALRTIENICSQGGDWATRFNSQDVINNLCYIFKAVGKQESTRLTAGSCLVRLGRDDFQITLLRILESITEEPSVIVEDHKIFISQILPSLTVLYKCTKDGDSRFLCLKILFDVMVIFLNEPLEDVQIADDLKVISNSHFLPVYPTLIEDEDPIPMYAQKLLVMLIEFNYIKISDILHTKTVSQCFEFLLGDLSSTNVNNVKLCLALASAPELETKILSQLRVVRKIGNLLEFVNAKEMEDFLEPTLDLCKAFLLRCISRKGSIYSKEPALLYDNSNSFHPQHSVKDISDFGSNIGLFLELSGSHETQVSDLASECVVFLVEAAPREATMGLLVNLHKISGVLESRGREISGILLLRMLHALGYSCRHYLSQAMILSISIPEITKIEAIVSDLKSSTTPSVATTASLVAVELQRLPRCL